MSETQALAPYSYEQQLQEMVATNGYIPKVAQIVLVHKSDEETGAVAGSFRDKQSGESFKSKNIVPLKFEDGRVYFPEDEAKSNKPICRSNDGKVPVTDDDKLIPQHANCKDCPKSQWRKIKKAGRTINVRPPCDQTMSLLYLDKDTGFPERINGKGTSVAPIRDFKETTFKKVMGSVAKHKQGKGEIIKHFELESEMSASKIVGTKGTYYVLNFTPPVPVDDPSDYGLLYERLVMNKGAERAEASEGAEAEEPTGSAAVSAAVGDQTLEGDYVDA